MSVERRGGIGDYEIDGVVGRGAAGVMHAGRYRRTGQAVTLEHIDSELARTAGFVARLAAAGRLATTVRHPNVVAVYDLVPDGDDLWLVGERCQGASLGALRAVQSLSPADAVAVVDDALAGLEALEAAGLHHGDIGDTTVVVDTAGRARLRGLATCDALAALGTRAVQHPDPAPGARPGAASDRQAIAALGLGLLGPAPPPEMGPVLELLERATDPQPLERPASTADFRRDLSLAAAAALGTGWRTGSSLGELARRTAAAPPPPGEPPAAAPPRRRRWGRRLRLVLIVAVIAAIVGAGVTVLVVQLAAAPSPPSGPLAVGHDARITAAPGSGGCNTTFVFTAQGSLSGAGTLVYRWEQSNGFSTPPISLPITSSEGSFQLSQAWQIQGTQTLDATMTFHILQPVDLTLRQPFHYACS